MSDYLYWKNHLYTTNNEPLSSRYNQKNKQHAHHIRSKNLIKYIQDYELVNTQQPRILELGCNIGRNCEYITEVFPKRLYTGIDICKNAITIVKEKYKHINNTEFICTNLFNLPHIPENYYDLIFSTGVLMHLNNSKFDSLIKRIYNIGKAGIFCEYYNPVMEYVEEPNNYYLVSRDYTKFFDKPNGIIETKSTLKWFWYKKE